MSDENEILKRLTEGDNLPQGVERHDITLRPTEDGDPPGLLREVTGNVKKHVPRTVEAGFGYLEAKSREAEAKSREAEERIIETRARANEIQAKARSEIGRLGNETQKLIDEREAKREEAANGARRDRNTHDRELRKLGLEELRGVCECIAMLREQGITVGVTVMTELEKRMKRHLRGK